MESERPLFLLLGVVIFSLVSLMRYRFAWWPLAPIGMVVPLTHAVHSVFFRFYGVGHQIDHFTHRRRGSLSAFAPLLFGVARRPCSGRDPVVFC